MKNTIYVAPSDINGDGLFTIEKIKEGEIIGVSHLKYGNYWYSVDPIGIYYNHSENPNCTIETRDNINLIIANVDIMRGEELTVDYREQPYLEQPNKDWIK